MENAANMSRVQKMTFSAMVMAIYIVVLYLTQSFSFGAYQIRIATALYALAYLFPFLVVPLGLANLLSNMLFGGFGIVDMLGGCIVGMVTCACIVLIRRQGWRRAWIAAPILLVPGLGGRDLSVLFSGDALPADGAQPVHRAAAAVRCGRGAGGRARARGAPGGGRGPRENRRMTVCRRAPRPPAAMFHQTILQKERML